MPRDASVRMPQTFFPRTNTSFTHLICAASPDTASIASHIATAAIAVKPVARLTAQCFGRSSRLM